jgi:hypothetical protein
VTSTTEHNPMGVREGQTWTHSPPEGRRTDYIVLRVWKHRALFFVDHGNMEERVTVILARMASDEWSLRAR